MDCTRQVSNLGNGGVPVHRDPVDGIVANPGKREWESWDPLTPAGWRQVLDPTMTEHGIRPGPSICYIYSGIK